MPIKLGCTMTELIDAVNAASGSSSEPYHIEVTAVSGNLTTDQYNSLKADANSYILYTSGSFKYMFKRMYEATSSGNMTYSCVGGNTSLLLSINGTTRAFSISSIALERQSNKVTSLSSSSTNTQYPSAKAVVDYVESQGGGGTPTNMVTTNTTQQIRAQKTFTVYQTFWEGMNVGVEGIDINNAAESAMTKLANKFWDGNHQLDYAATVNLPVVDSREASDVVMPATVDEGAKGDILVSNGGTGYPSVWKGLSYYNVNFAIKRSSSVAVFVSWGVVAPSGYTTVKALIQGITNSTSSSVCLNIPTSVSNYTYNGTTYSLGYLSTNGTPSGTTAYNTNGTSFTPYYSSSTETIGNIANEYKFFQW